MRTVGRYRLVEELGRGAAGAVFRALDPEGRRVALKLLHGGALAEPQARARFQAEVQALLRLRHPHVAALLDAGSEAGAPFLALEHVDGEALSTRLTREGPLAPRAAAELVRRLAEGLAHCHAQDVLHRDLKPENVLLRATTAEPVLVDFGLTREADARLTRSEALTREGTLLGTPGWWAPEQARGELQALGPRTDVWGLGALLMAALTGEAPCPAGTLAEALAGLERPLLPPSRRRQGIPPGLDAITLRCLQLEPDARYPDARAVASDLERWLLGRPLEAGSRRRLAAPLLLGGAALLVGLIAQRPGASRAPAPPPPRPAATPSPVGSAATPTAAPVSWAERWTRESARPAPRPDLVEAAMLDARVDEVWERHQRQLQPASTTARELAELTERGLARAEGHLGRLRLEQADCAAAAEHLLRASLPPQADRRARVLLAGLLAFGAPGLPPEPAAARLLLQAGPLEELAADLLASAAHAWARLGDPGELGLALRLIRDPRIGDSLGGALGHPREPALLIVARYEGWWGRPPEREAALAQLGELLLPGSAQGSRDVARRWLELAAVVGESGARGALAAAGLPAPEPEALDPRDLLGFAGSQAVRRSEDARELLELRSRLDRLRTAPGPLDEARLAELRALARQRLQPAEWRLGQGLWRAKGASCDPRGALVWFVLAALEPPGAGSEAEASLAVGRVLVWGWGCSPDPALGLRWLVVAQAAPGSRQAREEARLWRAVCALAGRGRPQDAPGGLVELLDAAPLLDPEGEGLDLLERVGRDDPWAEWAAGLVGRNKLRWGKLAQAARTDSAARRLLEALSQLDERLALAGQADLVLAELEPPGSSAWRERLELAARRGSEGARARLGQARGAR